MNHWICDYMFVGMYMAGMIASDTNVSFPRYLLTNLGCLTFWPVIVLVSIWIKLRKLR